MDGQRASHYRIAVIPGDGVGPEVTAAAQRVIEHAASRFRFSVEWHELTVGGAAIDRFGTPLRDADLDVCRSADAVLLGAIGGPRWDDPRAAIRPEQALLRLRAELELFANLRPVTVEPSLAAASPLRPELLGGVDLLIVRELTGGLYFGRPSGQRDGPDGRSAVDTLAYDEHQIARVVRLAFELAAGRSARLASVDKANVLSTSRLWRQVVDEVAPEFPGVSVEHRLVDSCAMLLVRAPATFDVIVTENLFGDILSDEAAVLAGSLGMLPSASLGTRRTSYGTFGLYEPVHGSAPDIAGQDRANPIGTLLSAAMMLRSSLGQAEAAAAVEAAVRRALADGHRTADLVVGTARTVGTVAFTDAVIERLAG